MQTAPTASTAKAAGVRLLRPGLSGNIEFALTYGELPAPRGCPPTVRTRSFTARMNLRQAVPLGMDASPDQYHAPQGFK